MTTKMKGLLKGLRYISQIFDNGNDKEQEMQIGYPTDVKHVAHIGWDGPSVSSPSWMNEFRSTPEYSSAPLSLGGGTKQDPKPKRTYEDPTRNGQDSPARNMPELPKPRRRTSSGTASSFDAVTQELPDAPKQARRQHQSTDGSINSPTRDPTDRIKPRRKTNSTPTMDPTLQELPSVPKQSRKKKSKNGSLGGGSTRLRSKGHPSTTYTSPFSDPGSGSGSKKSEPSLTSALKALDLEEKGGDQRVL